MTALSAIDPVVAERALEYLLSWPDTYGMDTVLVPAAVQLSEQPASRLLPAVERLRATGALRAKGFVDTADGLYLVQGVGARVELAETDAAPPPSLVGRVVLIHRA